MAVVGVISYFLFSVPRLVVESHNTQLLYAGVITQEYFIFMVLKDFSIVISQLCWGGFLGFWHAIVLHVITLPIDILSLLGLSIWGTIVMKQDGTVACQLDP